MLPGFRIFIATVMLSASVLIFGLGSAALLRATHEEFASQSSWRTAQPSIFPSQFEVQTPTLAMLRIEIPDVRPEVPQLTASPTHNDPNATTLEEHPLADAESKTIAEIHTAEHIATDTRTQELANEASGTQVTAIPIAEIEVTETKAAAEIVIIPKPRQTKAEQDRLAARHRQLAVLREREVLEAQQQALPPDPFTILFGGGIQPSQQIQPTSSQQAQFFPPIMLQ